MRTGDEAPDLSIVIPTRNREKLLGHAIESVLDQVAGFACEVIVVDNNSIDGTREVVDRYAKGAAAAVRYVFEARPGISYGRNAGIAAARGRLIGFLDDDCRAAPGWLAAITKTFEEHPEVSCIGGKVLPRWGAPPPRWLDRRHWSPLAITDYGDEAQPVNAERPRCLISANLAFRREVFDSVGQFSVAFQRSEDHELEFRLFGAGGQAMYVPALVATTDVPLERCTKAYHRRWHAQHGRDCAALRLNERIGARGELLEGEVQSVPVFGTPPFVYRELLLAVWSWLSGSLGAPASVAFERQTRVIFLASYILHRYRSWRVSCTASHVAEACSGAKSLLRRALAGRPKYRAAAVGRGSE
jgi:hypothetical protein